MDGMEGHGRQGRGGAGRDGELSALLADALAPVRSRCEGRPAVAVREADTPRAAVSGDGLYVAASVMKVNILAALLPGRQDEPSGRARELTVAGEVTAAAGTAGADPWELSARESAQAEAVIERSDNDAANALWRAAGGAEGIARANRRLGLTRTEPHRSDRWGLSCTTAADQLTLLEAVFGRGEDAPGRLADGARERIREPMGRAVGPQRWGVTAAGASRAPVELKNGWLPRTATGLWVLNSVGRVTAVGRSWLLAVLGRAHHPRGRDRAGGGGRVCRRRRALAGKPQRPQ
ncbi:serine hydrolase [Streptomyces axinellae]|uniref:Beta-lactamase class A catalytic domain-containing protein n=1 Tax=Streptomyces axinellae TaxID=552788 RepID=A0ABP6BXM4_9ACTN